MENIETPTPNPDEKEIEKSSPAKSEEIMHKIEKEAAKLPPKNDPDIKKKLEGEIEEKETLTNKTKESQKNKEKVESQKKIDSKKNLQQITPTPNEDDKLPLMKQEEKVESKPVPEKQEKHEEHVEVKESAPLGNNLGISLKIPEKDKKAKEESTFSIFLLFF